MCTSSVSNVIYHKFSHGAAFYTLNGKNINVMLEFVITEHQSKEVQDNESMSMLALFTSALEAKLQCSCTG